MSYPPNPLSRFRSLSYYFLMGVASNSRAAIEAANSAEIHATGGQEKYKTHTSDSGKWLLLINGAKDTQLIVKSLRTKSVLNSSLEHQGNDYHHATYLNGSIVLQEPLGISLYNILSEASCKLQTTLGSMVFFIKPIFVGYPPESSSEVIESAKPIVFVLNKMSSVINESGAIYNIEFFGTSNGQAETSRFQIPMGGFTARIPLESTLQESFKLAETQLNELYDKRRQRSIEEAQKQGLGNIYEGKRPIKFFFHLDPEYDDKYTIGTNDKPFFKEMQGTGAFLAPLGAKGGMQEFIQIMMESSDSVINDGDQYIFKILSFIDSTDTEYNVHYCIPKYEVATDENAKDVSNKLELDYIFTGKNLDVIEYDMKIEQGSAFFYSTTNSDSTHTTPEINQSEYGEGTNVGQATSSAEPPAAEVKCGEFGEPIVPGAPAISNEEARNREYPERTASYYNMLKRWTMLDSLIGRIVIRGNTDLLGETVPIITDYIVGNKCNYQSVEDLFFSKSGVYSSPLYVQMNVKFPADYRDPRGNFIDFWYNGLYFVSQIEHIFENGEFVQELQVFKLPTNITNEAKAGNTSGSTGGGGGGARNTAGSSSSAVDNNSTGSGIADAQQAVGATQQSTGNVVPKFVASVGGVVGKATGAISKVLGTISGVVSQVTGAISSAVSTAVNAATAVVKQAISVATKIAGYVTGTITQIVSVARSTIGSITETINGVIDQAVNAAGNVAGDLLQNTGIGQLVSSANVLSSSYGSISSAVNNFNNIGSLSGGIGAVNQLTGAVGGSADALSHIASATGGTQANAQIRGLITQKLQGLTGNVVNNTIGKVTGKAESLLGNIGNISNQANRAIGTATQSTVDLTNTVLTNNSTVKMLGEFTKAVNVPNAFISSADNLLKVIDKTATVLTKEWKPPSEGLMMAKLDGWAIKDYQSEKSSSFPTRTVNGQEIIANQTLF